MNSKKKAKNDNNASIPSYIRDDKKKKGKRYLTYQEHIIGSRAKSKAHRCIEDESVNKIVLSKDFRDALQTGDFGPDKLNEVFNNNRGQRWSYYSGYRTIWEWSDENRKMAKNSLITLLKDIDDFAKDSGFFYKAGNFSQYYKGHYHRSTFLGYIIHVLLNQRDRNGNDCGPYLILKFETRIYKTRVALQNCRHTFISKMLFDSLVRKHALAGPNVYNRALLDRDTIATSRPILLGGSIKVNINNTAIDGEEDLPCRNCIDRAKGECMRGGYGRKLPPLWQSYTCEHKNNLRIFWRRLEKTYNLFNQTTYSIFNSITDTIRSTYKTTSITDAIVSNMELHDEKEVFPLKNIMVMGNTVIHFGNIKKYDNQWRNN